MKQIINSADAPQAIGCYSQAVRFGNTIYLSGQIGLDPMTMELASDFSLQLHQVFRNLQAVVASAGATLNDIIKLNIYLTKMDNFSEVNLIMQQYMSIPFPARAVVAVAALPKGALVEIDAVLGCTN